VSIAPDPDEIFDRAVEEGERRLDQSLLELTATSFIAGFTIVFGIAALGVVDALVEPRFGDVAHIAGALAFGVGVVFLVVGRTELFNENFFDPAAKAIDEDGSWLLGPSFGCGPSPSSSISSAGSSSRSSSRSTASSRRDRRTHCPGPPKGSSTDRCGVCSPAPSSVVRS